MAARWKEQFSESAQAVRTAAANPNIRRLELAWMCSISGLWTYTIALSVFAYEEGGAAAVGLVGAIRLFPAAIAAPFAAGLGDRFPRERVLLVAGILRTLLMVAAALAVFSSVPALAVYCLAGVENLVGTVFRPLQGALLPVLSSSPEELTAANLGFATIESVATFAGPTLGGLLLATTSTGTVFAVTAGIYACATLLVGRIRAPQREGPREETASAAAKALAGFRTIAADANLRLIIGLYGAQTLVAGALNVLIVVTSLQLLDLGQAGVGFLTAAVGIGGLVGAVVALALVGRERLASDFGLGLVLWGVPIALIGVFPEPPVALVLLGLVGIGVTVVDVAAVTLLQRVVPDEVLARVFGVLQTVFVATIGFGAIAAPLLVTWLGARGALIATGALLPTLSVLLWTRLRALDGVGMAPEDTLELLRSLPIFRPLPAPIIEELASKLVAVNTSAGEQVIREGDPGDRFYLIGAGEVNVHSDGRPMATLGPGDYFGEIALLRDVPRTATVEAKTHTRLYALDRDEFLSAVTGHPESAEAADAVVASRLAGLRPGLGSV
ncbi:MAG TPA: MFS transporter [Gaiellaceae bacterium]